mgnify:CR=1 FL=1
MSTERMIGASSAWAEALDHVSLLAPIDRAALVIGERGTGKELIAERLHFLSPRWENALIKVNCAAFSDSLLESELFGHEAGAFTGASARHLGRFERASGGTLFLDELGTLPDRVQEKILRVIEYGEFERLGSQQTQSVDVRIIAATNADLPSMVERGKFRGDLLDRLAFDVISLPPLRKRGSDIVELSNHFAVRMCSELGWDLFPGFTDSAMAELRDWHWPGNVRELKNAIERSIYRWGLSSSPIDTVVIDPFKDVSMTTTDEDGDKATSTPTIDDTAHDAITPFSDTVLAFERRLLKQALTQAEHHQGEAAKSLGLSYHQFRGLFRKHKL